MNDDVFIHAITGQSVASEASPAPADSTNPADRRRSARRAYPTVATLTLLGSESGHSLQVRVINVSQHGVGLRAPVPFDCGAQYRFRIGGDALNLESHLRIVSSRRRSDGQYDTGAEYI